MRGIRRSTICLGESKGLGEGKSPIIKGFLEISPSRLKHKALVATISLVRIVLSEGQEREQVRKGKLLQRRLLRQKISSSTVSGLWGTFYYVSLLYG